MSILIVQNVAMEFPTRTEPLVVLRAISCELSAGEGMAVVGPSGSGMVSGVRNVPDTFLTRS